MSSRKWHCIVVLLCGCTFCSCRSHDKLEGNNSNTKSHEEAMLHLAQGIAHKNRGLGAGPSVPRATQEDREIAVSEFKTALRLEPDNHQASFGLAEVLLQLGKNEEGTAILQTLAKNNDEWARHAQRKLTKMGAASTR